MPQTGKPFPKVKHEYPTTTKPKDLKVVAKAVGVDLCVCPVCGELGLQWNNETRFTIHEVGIMWPHNIKWAHDALSYGAVIWQNHYWVPYKPPEPEPRCKCHLSATGCLCGLFEEEFEKRNGKKALHRLNTLRGKR